MLRTQCFIKPLADAQADLSLRWAQRSLLVLSCSGSYGMTLCIDPLYEDHLRTKNNFPFSYGWSSWVCVSFDDYSDDLFDTVG